jgi:hypothetical protein
MNPAYFLFDWEELDRGEDPVVRFALPYTDKKSLPPERYQKLIEDGELLEFSHSLDDQVGGQIDAGFHLVLRKASSVRYSSILDLYYFEHPYNARGACKKISDQVVLP